MESLLEFNKQTVGKDKLTRLLQYTCRVYWYNLQKFSVEEAERFRKLEFQLSTFRKLLRFGQSAERAYSILPYLYYRDVPVRIFVILSSCCRALYLFCDHTLWLERVNLWEIDTLKWKKLAQKYRLYSIIVNLGRDFYETCKLLWKEKAFIVLDEVNGLKDILRILRNGIFYFFQYKPVWVDTIKNSSDLFIPLRSLRAIDISPGTVGIFGMISSVAGIVTLVEPLSSLYPEP